MLRAAFRARRALAQAVAQQQRLSAHAGSQLLPALAQEVCVCVCVCVQPAPACVQCSGLLSKRKHAGAGVCLPCPAAGTLPGHTRLCQAASQQRDPRRPRVPCACLLARTLLSSHVTRRLQEHVNIGNEIDKELLRAHDLGEPRHLYEVMEHHGEEFNQVCIGGAESCSHCAAATALRSACLQINVCTCLRHLADLVAQKSDLKDEVMRNEKFHTLLGAPQGELSC